MKKLIPISCLIGVILLLVTLVINDKNNLPKTIEGNIIALENDLFVFKDNEENIYEIKYSSKDFTIGDTVVLEYTGILNTPNSKIISVASTKRVNGENTDLSKLSDGGIFEKFYKQAYNKLTTLNIDEKIGQLLLARYPKNKEGNKYGLTGYVFYENDFQDKTKEQVLEMIDSLSSTAKIPLLMAVDEEGGKVVRVSSNPNLASSPFRSPKVLYDEGGLELIKNDTIQKNKLLASLHLNVNLAPVVDVATNPDSYIYPRTIGYGEDITSKYADTVIFASKGSEVSYVLKHFPGYGDNTDTHSGASVDSSTYDDIINKNLLPFKAGIEAGAEAVLVSHNTVRAIEDVPASLSPKVHNLLRTNLGFLGVSITDDLDMGATKDIENRYVKALLAGNDILIVTNYQDAFNEIKTAVNSKQISENYIDKLALRVLAWKYYKLLIMENNK